MKTKFKVLVAFIVAICITTMGTVVNAATEFSTEDKSAIVTLDKDLGIDGTKTEAKGVSTHYKKLGKDYEVVDLRASVRILGIDQDKMDAYVSSKKSYKTTIKIKWPSDLPIENIDKITVYSGNESEFSIEVIDGEKYLVYHEEVEINLGEYSLDNYEYYYSIESSLLNANVWHVTLKDGTFYEVRATFYGINLHSKKDMNYTQDYVNNNDSIYKETSDNTLTIVKIPSTAELSETYYKLYLEKYQGESIKVENFGTLKYAGIQEMKFKNDGLFEDTMVVYVYVNTLNNLKAAAGKALKFVDKDGYVVSVYGYMVSSDADEIPVNGLGAESTYKFSDKLTITVGASGKFDLRALEIDSTDALYKKLLEGYNKKTTIDEENYDIKDTMVFDLYKYRDALTTSSTSNYSGNSKRVTFTVGSSHNGEKYVVGHLVNGEEYEHEEGIVENGKITIEVESLSPFMLTLAAKKEDDKKDPVTPESPTTPEEPTTPENPTTPEEPTTPEVPDTKPDTDTKVDTDKKGELDETPKTGSEKLVSNVVSLSSITALISLAGVVVCKKEQ